MDLWLWLWRLSTNYIYSNRTWISGHNSHTWSVQNQKTKLVFLTLFLIKTATKFYLFVIYVIADNAESEKKWVVTRNKRYWSKCKKRTWWQSFIFVEIHFSLDSNIFHKMYTMLYIQCQRRHWKKSSALSTLEHIHMLSTQRSGTLPENTNYSHYILFALHVIMNKNAPSCHTVENKLSVAIK